VINGKIKSMKAKHFKKLRALMHVYLVQKTPSLFGSFNDYDPDFNVKNWNGEEVMARNPEEAVKRYKKRHHLYRIYASQTSSQWGHYRAILKEKPFERYTTYWD
jgi:hypothetical protein